MLNICNSTTVEVEVAWILANTFIKYTERLLNNYSKQQQIWNQSYISRNWVYSNEEDYWVTLGTFESNGAKNVESFSKLFQSHSPNPVVIDPYQLSYS